VAYCERVRDVFTLAAKELERRREIVRNWSYCTDAGMRKECPEKVEELANDLISLGIAPYSMRS